LEELEICRRDCFFRRLGAGAGDWAVCLLGFFFIGLGIFLGSNRDFRVSSFLDVT
jgi:hypothetical protein